MRLSISQITTVTQSFADDLDAYREAGTDGIGIWEMNEGFYDLEIFSDAELEGSLWRQDPRDVARRGVEALRRTASSGSA